MDKEPLLSIITPVFNAESTIYKTIKSIKNQGFEDFEFIIIDSNSKDNSSKIIKEHSSLVDKYIVEEDNGIYDAMNKGINLAKGKIIGIINADDQYNMGSFFAIKNAYQDNLKGTIFFSDLIVTYGSEKIIMKADNRISSIKLGNSQISHPTMFVPKEIYLKYGSFNLNFDTYGADRELILRFKKQKVKFCKLDHNISIFNFGGATSNYDLKNIIKQTIQEFNLLKMYFTIPITIKTTIKFFLRLLRNLVLSKILPRSMFLKFRIRKLGFTIK